MKRRLLSIVLAIAMVVSAMPATSLAAEGKLCEHHLEHIGCSYAEFAEPQPCTHVHEDGCYQRQTACVHIHDESCYPASVEGDMPSGEATACAHVGFCSEETGCVTSVLECPHTHDESCEYQEGRQAIPCDFDCTACEAEVVVLPDETAETTQISGCCCEETCGENGNADCPVCASDAAACQGEEEAILPFTLGEETGEEDVPPITRAQWLQLLVETFEMTVEDDRNLPDNYFSDLSSDSEYYRDILLAVEFGVVDIPAGGAVEPDAAATREFAAHTLNFCLGYQWESSSYSFADFADCQYPADDQIAVNRGWFQLVEGAFLPELPITEEEKDRMLADAVQVRNSTSVNPDESEGYQFADGVVVFPYGTDYEISPEGTVTIYNEPLLAEGVVFALYPTYHFPELYQTVTVSGDDNLQTITTSAATNEEEYLESVNIQGTMALDLSNFEPAEGMTAQLISTEAEAASFAAKTGSRLAVGSLALEKKLDCGNGATVSIAIGLSDMEVSYRLDSETDTHYLKISGDSRLSLNSNVSLSQFAGMPDELEIGRVWAYGVELVISATLNLEGSVTLNIENQFAAGIQKNASGVRLIRSFSKKSFSVIVEAKFSTGLKISTGVNVLALKGHIYAETGAAASMESQTYTDGTAPANCTDLNSWLYFNIGAEAKFFFATVVEVERPIYDEGNSPARLGFHYEDGEKVDKCTRGDKPYVTPEHSPLGGSTSLGGGNYLGGGTAGLFQYGVYEDGAHIFGYNGTASVISIPSYVDGHKVVAVETLHAHVCPTDLTYHKHTPIRMLVIPEGVTYIGDLRGRANEYVDLTQLHTVILPNSLKEINEMAFANTSLTSLTLPSGIEIIGGGFLSGVKGVTKLTVPNTVTQMDRFLSESYVQELIFEEGLETIGENSCRDATNLVSVSIPDSVKTIGDRAFANCGLQSLTLPKNLVNLGAYILSVNTGVKELVIPSTVNHLDENYCLNGSGVERLVFEEGTERFSSHFAENAKSLTTVVLPETLTAIPAYAFLDCTVLETINLPDSITEIGYSAFERSGLKELTIPQYVTGAWGPLNKSNLETLRFAEGMTEIPEWFFGGGDNGTLKEVILPDTMEIIGNSAFYGCHALEKINIPDSLKEIRQDAFQDTSLKSLVLPEGFQVLERAFGGVSTLEAVTIPASITSCYEAFYGAHLKKLIIADGSTCIPGSICYHAEELREVVIPESVTSIGGFSFAYCTSLTSVDLPANVQYIDNSAFRNSGLTAITLPESVQTIQMNAFAECASLTEVVIPAQVEELGFYVFENCTSLRSVTFLGDENSPQWRVNDDAFRGCTSLTSVTFQRQSPSLMYAAAQMFAGVTATVYYPKYDESWTEEIRLQYGGNLTWVPYDDHEHAYDQEVAASTYLKSEATCIAQAVYYKSCKCGLMGTDTFVHGELGNHRGGMPSCTAPTVCTLCGASFGSALGHSFAYSCSGMTVTETCVNGCGHEKTAQITVTPEVYDGTPATVQLTVPEGWGGQKEPAITYAKADGTALGSQAPSAPGDYIASLDFGQQQVVQVAFTIQRENRYPVNGLTPGQSMEINGILYTADETGTILLADGEDKVVTTYAYGESEMEDPLGITAHQSYPTGMQVKLLVWNEAAGSYQLEEISVLNDLLTYKGTSIRMTGNQGIRIFTAVNEAKRAGLIDGSLLSGTSLAGYKLVECGTLFQFGTLDGASLVYDASRNNRSIAYGSGRDAIFSRQDGDIWFTGMLVNLKPELCDDELVLRPYMVLKNAEGKQLVLYGGTLQRNIGYVAYQNKDYKPSQEAEDFIWNIIRTVYGDKVTG